MIGINSENKDSIKNSSFKLSETQARSILEIRLSKLTNLERTKLSDDLKDKLALFCNVKREAIIQSIDVETIYDVPMKMLNEGLDREVLKKLNLTPTQKHNLKPWEAFLERFKNPKNKIKIGLVIILTGYHFYLFGILKNFEIDSNTKSSKFFKIINEVPTLLLIIIIFIVIFKPL